MPDTPMTDAELDALQAIADKRHDADVRTLTIADADLIAKAAKTLRARIAPAMEAEPVAWQVRYHSKWILAPSSWTDEDRANWPGQHRPLYPHPAPRDLASGQQVRDHDRLTELADLIEQNVTENDLQQHRLLLNGEAYTGPAVDWSNRVLSGLRDLMRKYAALTPAPVAVTGTAPDDHQDDLMLAEAQQAPDDRGTEAKEPDVHRLLKEALFASIEPGHSSPLYCGVAVTAMTQACAAVFYVPRDWDRDRIRQWLDDTQALKPAPPAPMIAEITGLTVAMVTTTLDEDEDLPDGPCVILRGDLDAVAQAGRLFGRNIALRALESRHD